MSWCFKFYWCDSWHTVESKTSLSHSPWCPPSAAELAAAQSTAGPSQPQSRRCDTQTQLVDSQDSILEKHHVLFCFCELKWALTKLQRCKRPADSGRLSETDNILKRGRAAKHVTAKQLLIQRWGFCLITVELTTVFHLQAKLSKRPLCKHVSDLTNRYVVYAFFWNCSSLTWCPNISSFLEEVMLKQILVYRWTNQQNVQKKTKKTQFL